MKCSKCGMQIFWLKGTGWVTVSGAEVNCNGKEKSEHEPVAEPASYIGSEEERIFLERKAHGDFAPAPQPVAGEGPGIKVTIYDPIAFLQELYADMGRRGECDICLKLEFCINVLKEKQAEGTPKLEEIALQLAEAVLHKQRLTNQYRDTHLIPMFTDILRPFITPVCHKYARLFTDPQWADNLELAWCMDTKFCRPLLNKNTAKLKVFLATSANTAPCPYHIGQTVFWNGQLGECSGKIIDITHPENSDYVLVLDIGDGVEMPHSVRGVWATPASTGEPQTQTCPRCEGHCNVYDYEAMAGPAQDFSRSFDQDAHVIPCPACQGSGRINL